MTKPIEWTTPAKTVTVPGDTLRLDVRYPIWEDGERMGHSWRDATPSDLASAISAMGEGERAEVLTMAAAQGVPGAITVRLASSEEVIEKLKAERDDARLRCGAALATAATATARADTAAASHLASAGLVAEFRGRLAAAESALDVAQSRAVRAEKLADEALADRDRARASLDIVRHDLRGTRAEVDALRSRLIAAETAAAQREPREYPLAEGSRWEGDEIVDALGQRISDSGMGALHLDWNAIRRAALWQNVFALAHRRGML